MANLTWRDTVAPNFGGVQDSINSATRMFSNAASGAGAALGQFGDQNVMQQLAQYTDAQKLQADLQSGQFSTANASSEALGKVMGRSANLLSDAAAQQQMDYRAELNPVAIAGQKLLNTSTGLANDHSIVMNPLKEASSRQANVASLDTFNEMVGNRNAGYEATAWYDRNVKSGMFDTPGNIDILRSEVEKMEPRLRAKVLPMLAAANPEAFTPQRIDGVTAVGSSSPGATGLIAGAAAGSTASTGTGTSVGERNNNQGNLMGSGWVTKMPGYLGNDDKGFAKFSSNEQGNAANNRQLERYWDGTEATGGKPVRTINGIINTWAPPESGTNKTGNSAASVANYKAYVQKRTGIDMTKELTKDQLGSVRTAMQEFETGNTGGISNKDVAKIVKSGTAVAALADTVVKADSMFSANPLASQMYQAGSADPKNLMSVAAGVKELKATFPSMDEQDLSKLIGETRSKLGGVSVATVIPLLANSAGTNGGFFGKFGSYGVNSDVLSENIKSMVGDGKTPGVAFRALMDEQARLQQTQSVSEDLGTSNDARKKALANLKSKINTLPAGPRRDAQVQAAQLLFESDKQDAEAAVAAAAARGIPYNPVAPAAPTPTPAPVNTLLEKASTPTMEKLIGADTGDVSINAIVAKNIPRIQAASDNVKNAERQMAQVVKSGDPVAIKSYAQALQDARDSFEKHLKGMSPARAAEIRKLVG